MEHYPASRYAPYVAEDAIGLPHSRHLEDARKVLDSQPHSPIRDYAQLFVARMEAALAGPETRSNMECAIELTERARADYLAIGRTSSDPELRQISRIEREKLQSLEDLQRRANSQPPSAQ